MCAGFFVRYPASFALMVGRDYRDLTAGGVALHAIGGRRAIVGRSGKYVRKQIWGRIVVTGPAREESSLLADAALDVDLPDD